MKIITWQTYKKEKGFEPYITILIAGLEEQGFVELPIAMRTSLDKRKPKEIVAEAVAGQNFSLVIYQINDTAYQKGYTITIYAR